MATNHHARWVGNLNGLPRPMIYRALFQAGGTQAIKAGEILEFTGNSNLAFVPIDSDFDMSGGDIAIANEEIKSGDRAGYYEVIVPRPGDIFEFELSSAADTAFGSELYYNSSEKVATSGTNVLGIAVGQEHYPQKQGHLSDDAAGDAGTTIKDTSHIRMTICERNSYFSRLVQNDLQNGILLVKKLGVTASGDTDIPVPYRDFRVISAYATVRDATTATDVKLTAGSTDICAAVTVGTTADHKFDLNINDAVPDISAGSTFVVNLATTCTSPGVDVFIFIQPLA